MLHRWRRNTQRAPFHDFQLQCNYLPIYYNAWENDYDEDPALSITKVLVTDYAELSGLEKIPPEVNTIIKELIGSFGFSLGIEVKGSDLINAFESEDMLAALRRKQKIRSNLCRLIENVHLERADKVVLFIDELDRCRPSYALKLLEEIKFLFNQENILVVLSTDISMLAKTVEGYYGAGYEGNKYLSRFYDQLLCLESVDTDCYLGTLGLEYTMVFFDSISREIAKAKSYTMRQCNRYYQDIKAIRERVLDSGMWMPLLVISGFTAALLAIKAESVEEYNLTMNGQGEDSLWEVLKNSSAFLGMLEKVYLHENPRAERDGFIPEDYYRSIYNSVFNCTIDKEGWTTDFYGDALKKQLVSILSEASTRE